MEEGGASILGSGGQQGELFVMGASLTWWEGDQFGFHGGAMCKATLDFVRASTVCKSGVVAPE